MQIEVTPETARVLVDVLDRALGDTREEIYKTDLAEVKARLKTRETILQSLLAQVRTPAT